jgi:hypothetical protein
MGLIPSCLSLKNILTMANLKPTANKRKLTVAGHAELGKIICRYPNIAKVLEHDERASMLEGLLQGTKLLSIEEEVSIKLKEVVQRLDCLTTMEQIVGRKPASQILADNTAARLLQDHPPLGAYMMHFLGEAVGYDELLRQLITHHNFESLEPGDINDLIYQVEELRGTFRELAAIHGSKTHKPHHVRDTNNATNSSKAA